MAKPNGPSKDGKTFVFPTSAITTYDMDGKDFPTGTYRTEVNPRSGRRENYWELAFETDEQKAVVQKLVDRWNEAFEKRFPYVIRENTLERKEFLDKLGADYVNGPQGWARTFSDTPERTQQGVAPAKDRYEAAINLLESDMPDISDVHTVKVRKQLKELGATSIPSVETRNGKPVPAWVIAPDAKLDPVELGQRTQKINELVVDSYELKGIGASLQIQQKKQIIDLGITKEVFGEKATVLTDLDHAGDITVTGALEKANKIYEARLAAYAAAKLDVPVDEKVIAAHEAGLLIDRERAQDQDGFPRVFRTITAAANAALGKEYNNKIGADTLIDQATQQQLEEKGRTETSRDARNNTGGYVIDEDTRRLAKAMTGPMDNLAETLREVRSLQEAYGVDASAFEPVRAEKAFVGIGPIVAFDKHTVIQQIEIPRKGAADGEIDFAYVEHDRQRVVTAKVPGSVSIGYLVGDESREDSLREAVEKSRSVVIGEIDGVRIALSGTRIREQNPKWEDLIADQKQNEGLRLIEHEFNLAKTAPALKMANGENWHPLFIAELGERARETKNPDIAASRQATLKEGVAKIEAAREAAIARIKEEFKEKPLPDGRSSPEGKRTAPQLPGPVAEVQVRSAVQPVLGRFDEIRGKLIVVARMKQQSNSDNTVGFVETGKFALINRNDSRDMFKHEPAIAQAWKKKSVPVTIGFSQDGAMVVQPGVKNQAQIEALARTLASALPGNLERKRVEKEVEAKSKAKYNPDLHEILGNKDSENRKESARNVEAVALQVARERGINVNRILVERQDRDKDYTMKRALNDAKIYTKVAKITNAPTKDGIAVMDFDDVKKLDGLVRYADPSKIIVSNYDAKTKTARIYEIDNLGPVKVRDSESVILGGATRDIKVDDVIEFRELSQLNDRRREFQIEIVDKAVTMQKEANAEAYRRNQDAHGEIELDDTQRSIVSSIVAGGLKKAGYTNVKSVELLEKDDNGVHEGVVRPITFQGQRLVALVANEATYKETGKVQVWEFRDPAVVDKVFRDLKANPITLDANAQIFARGEEGNDDLAARVFAKNARGEMAEAGNIGKVVISDKRVTDFSSISPQELALANAARAELERIQKAAARDGMPEQEQMQQAGMSR